MVANLSIGIEWSEVALQTVSRYFIIACTSFLIFYKLFTEKFIAKKIQSRFPKNSDYYRDITYSVITSGVFGAYFIFVFVAFKNHVKLFSDVNQMPWWYHALSFLIMILIHDTYFYWTHRMMHHPKLFKYFHLTHHKSHNPSPWSAYAFHPLEAIVEGGIILLLAVSISAWTPIFILFFIFQLIVNVYGHTGFELFPKSFNKNWIGKWINTSVAHNMHHKYFKGNYSLYFMIWDRLMGTVHEKYDIEYKNLTKNKLQ